MLWYTTQRLWQTIPTLLLISVLIFLMVRLIPGDPALLMAGEDATPEIVDGVGAGSAWTVRSTSSI